MSQEATSLEVRGLWKVFGRHPERILGSEWRHKNPREVQDKTGHVIALRDINFDVGLGETFVVMGLSGSGKSTLVRCLLRLIEPSEGQILMDGEDILQYDNRKLIQFRRKKAGMIFQRFGLLPHRSVVDNVAFGLEIQGVDHRARLKRASELLETVGLKGWENNMPDELSGGMQQRVGLARALAADPEILLMDEPFSALDPLIRREMQAELISLQGRLQKTIVFITHDLDEALKLGDRIAVMRDGVVVQLGTPEDILANPADEYVDEFTKDVRKAAVLPIRTIMTRPRSVVHTWQGPRVALRRMREVGEEVAFVTDQTSRFQGYLTTSSAAKAAHQGVKTLSGLLEKSPIVLAPDSSVETLLGMAADYDWSLDVLPVVDEDGKLVGEVTRAMVREAAVVPESEVLNA